MLSLAAWYEEGAKCPPTCMDSRARCWKKLTDAEGLAGAFAMPGGTGERPRRASDPSILQVWGWDGNEDKPTLTPSIHVFEGERTIWHGYATAGELVG